MNIQRTTLESILRAFGVASEESHKVTLNQVLLDATGDKLVVVACDGHRLSRDTVVDADTLSLIAGRRVVIARNQLPILKLLLKENKRRLDFEVSAIGEGLNAGANGLFVRFKSENEARFPYPNYKLIIPRLDAYTVAVGVNPELLISIANALKETSRSVGIVIRINPNDTKAPLYIESCNGDGVVMPMRMPQLDRKPEVDNG